MQFQQIFTTATVCTLAVFMWISCGETLPSATLQQAKTIHEQMDRLSAEVHDELQAAIGLTEVKIEASLENGDSLMAMQMARFESQLGELDVRFHNWESTVVPLPGAECDHDHDHSGEDHEHGHHHSHDHGSSASLEGMSDDAILEIQQALMSELTAMIGMLNDVQVALNLEKKE
jgi:hypothetical protein